MKPGQGERNFHVFYQLVQGAPRDERSRLCLLDSADAYPSLASCTSVEGIDDSQEFNDTAKAMADVGLDDATADLSLRVVAACLALGLLSFAPLTVGDAEGSQIRESAPLDAACSLLHLDPTALKDALASRTLETMAPGGKTETYQVPLNPTQASLARDALVKSIYSKLFDELVRRINAAVGGQRGVSIGVLDIFGFEIFEHNSFEQASRDPIAHHVTLPSSPRRSRSSRTTTTFSSSSSTSTSSSIPHQHGRARRRQGSARQASSRWRAASRSRQSLRGAGCRGWG